MNKTRTRGRPRSTEGEPFKCVKCGDIRLTKSRKRYISCSACHCSQKNPLWDGNI